VPVVKYWASVGLIRMMNKRKISKIRPLKRIFFQKYKKEKAVRKDSLLHSVKEPVLIVDQDPSYLVIVVVSEDHRIDPGSDRPDINSLLVTS
jgi:hypothetical protein